MSYHGSGHCGLCQSKAWTGHPTLAEWFWKAKAVFPDMHASCFFRDQKEQEIAVRDGRSRSPWPHSLHNATLEGSPCSRAFDCFQIRPDGVAYFGRDYYARIAEWYAGQAAPLLWGGGDKTPKLHAMGDFPHFQLLGSVV